MSNALDFNDVHKSYGNHKVFDGFNYRVQQGEVLAFLGANGSGKSTFISLASGILKPNAGEIQILGLKAGVHALKAQVRCLTQELTFPAQLTVQEIVHLVTTHFRAPWPRTLLEELDLERLLLRRTGGLSGGESRRLGLVIALIGDPELILLDEPTSNLDLNGQRAVQDVLVKHLRRTSATLIFSSHRMSEVERLASRITVINQGRVLADGPTQKIRESFGLAKVSFISEQPILQLASARSLVQSSSRHEAIGPDADAILRELIQGHSSAREFHVQQAPLEEIIVQLWARGAP